ncbi:MAG: ATP-binding protein [Phycisphaerales bacterium]|nr:ATP-binding protein [Phycisphaerales bacterium]
MTESDSHRSAVEHSVVLRHDRADIEAAQRALLDAVSGQQYDPASTFAIRLAVEEAINNAFKHGNESDPGKTVTLAYRIDPRAVEIQVEDQGAGFDVQAVPDPTQPENIEIPCGRGIVLMRAYMTRVEYVAPGNKVRMRYERPTT